MESISIELPKEISSILFENNPLPMFICDISNFQILKANIAAINKYDFRLSDFLSMKLQDIRVDHIPIESLFSKFENRINYKENVDARHKTRAGEIIYVEETYSPIQYNGKDAVVVSAYDVTKLKNLEHNFDIQFNISKILAESYSFDQAVHKILKIVCIPSSMDVGELWFESKDRKYLELQSYWYSHRIDSLGLYSITHSLKQTQNSSIIGKVWQEGKPITITEFTPYIFTRNDFFVSQKFSVAFLFPIISSFKTIGVLTFFSRSKVIPDNHFLMMLESLGEHIGVFHQKYFDSQKLRQNELRLKGIFESAMDAIISIDAEYKIQFFNLAAEKMFLCKAEDVIGKSINIFIPDNLQPIHSQHISDFNKSGATNKRIGLSKTLYGVRMNKEEFPIEASISQINMEQEKLFTVIIKDITEKKIADERNEASLKEKEVLLKEIHHRVKNNLQIISSLLSLQSNYLTDPNIINLFNESKHRVKAMALIHEKLYKSSSLSKINFKEYVNDLLYYLVNSYDFKTGNVSLNLNIKEISISLDSIVPFGLILNELVSNSLKYAFPNCGKGVISVSFDEYENEKYLLIFQDDGIGMKNVPDIQNAATLGMQLIFNLTEQLKGTIKFEVTKGTKVLITVPNTI